jgi:hypothetical protein
MIKKLIQKRRAVSPILAAILLIGLAVTAGAIIIVFVLPMLEGASNVGFVAGTAVADDVNNDGLLDEVTFQVNNEGTVVDTLSEGTFTAGTVTWSSLSNIEIPLGTPVDLTFSTDDVTNQITDAASVSIVLSFDSGAEITITEAQIEMDNTATLTDGDMLIDFTDANGVVRSSTAILDQESTGAVDETHSGNGGFRVRMDGTNTGDAYVYRHATAADGDARPGSWTLADSPETITLSDTPVLSLWLKKATAGAMPTNTRIFVGFVLFDAATDVDAWFYYQINVLAFPSTYTANTWSQVIFDMTSVTWGGLVNPLTNYPSGVFGGFTLWFDNNPAAGNLNVYVDDVSVHTGF